MANPEDVTVLTQQEVDRVILQGRRECERAAALPLIEELFRQYPPHVGRYWLELYLWRWPATLLLKLPWGPNPHFWVLGGCPTSSWRKC